MKMKTRIIGLAVLLFGLSVSLWTACDKIPEDETRISTELPEWQGKTVVLEDFTGVGCTNCPDAANIAHDLQTLMGDRIIVVELHAATEVLAPLTTPRVAGEVNLVSQEATTYATNWQVTGLPQGLINRKQASGEALARGRWRGIAISTYGEVPVATIEATASLEGSAINISANGIFPKAYECNDIRVLAMVLEDGFSVTQVVNGEEQSGYIHNHVLRETNEEWGVHVLDAVSADSTRFDYMGTINVASDWNKANLSVAVLLCNGETKEILNAAKVKLN